MTMRQVETGKRGRRPPASSGPDHRSGPERGRSHRRREGRGQGIAPAGEPLPPDAAPALRLGKRLANQPQGPRPGIGPARITRTATSDGARRGFQPSRANGRGRPLPDHAPGSLQAHQLPPQPRAPRPLPFGPRPRPTPAHLARQTVRANVREAVRATVAAQQATAKPQERLAICARCSDYHARP